MSTVDIISALCPRLMFGDFPHDIYSDSTGIMPHKQYPATFAAVWKVLSDLVEALYILSKGMLDFLTT